MSFVGKNELIILIKKTHKIAIKPYGVQTIHFSEFKLIQFVSKALPEICDRSNNAFVGSVDFCVN